ncbi:hypothetical protein [Actinomadura decatromicini]|uniref:Uncharacterized protein n=1 Tax=Actinomadura decatromicini TaxID=2604572 RepID=A0A5D3FST5_9ACTN|nr:hypothetical protein [Actinomadura decatromicini]TYK51082.1 hypothetical protein FXF68_11575 [Actinomadura decatromicini]
MRSKILFCSSVELLIILPALTGYVMWLIQRWISKSLRALTLNDWLNAVLYPSVGTIAGAVAGAGFSEGIDSHGRAGLGLVVGALVGTVLIASAGTAIIRTLAIRTAVEPFSRIAWERDLSELDQKRQLSLEDRKWFVERSALLHQEGAKQSERADGMNFGTYWRARPRKARLAALGMPLVGIAASIAGTTWIKPSLVWGVVWLVITLPLGGSMLTALRFDYAIRRNSLELSGRELQDAARLIDKRLELIPVEHRPSFGRRLRQLLM